MKLAGQWFQPANFIPQRASDSVLAGIVAAFSAVFYQLEFGKLPQIQRVTKKNTEVLLLRLLGDYV